MRSQFWNRICEIQVVLYWFTDFIIVAKKLDFFLFWKSVEKSAKETTLWKLWFFDISLAQSLADHHLKHFLNVIGMMLWVFFSLLLSRIYRFLSDNCPSVIAKKYMKSLWSETNWKRCDINTDFGCCGETVLLRTN